MRQLLSNDSSDWESLLYVEIKRSIWVMFIVYQRGRKPLYKATCPYYSIKEVLGHKNNVAIASWVGKVSGILFHE